MQGGGDSIFNSGWIWWILAANAFLLWLLLRRRRQMVEEPLDSEVRSIGPEEIPAAVRESMDVRFAAAGANMKVFRGSLREPADQVFARLQAECGDATPFVQPDEEHGAVIFLGARPQTPERPFRFLLPWLLFALTLLTTTIAGAAQQGIDLWSHPHRFAAGLPYAAGLLSILGLHELGHYFAAKSHGMKVSPPYFIPVPFALGTFGAFIQMRSPAENRKSLFDMAVAGPLAGLAAAIPALIIGLRQSQLIPFAGAAPQGDLDGTGVSTSILFTLLVRICMGDIFSNDYLLQLSPLAFAGWLGLLVTALNLLPIGQLDGGHIARSMFGHRAGTRIGSAAHTVLFALAIFVWPGLLMWAILIFFIARNSSPPLEDITALGSGRKLLGYFTFVILALITIPFPFELWDRVSGR